MQYSNIISIGENTWYIPAPVNIGVFVSEGKAILIDSGNDKEAGRQLNKLIRSQGWELDLIINTHANADHIGGNAFLQKKTGCRTAATAVESAFIRTPVLEPVFLYGGYPFSGIRNKFLEAQPSEVTDIIEHEGKILETPLEAVPLPGHYFDMIGIRTPDNVFFIADSVFSEQIIDKYHIFFIYDVAKYLETLDYLLGAEASLYVPSHADPAEDIGSLVEKNRTDIKEISGRILDICSVPVEFDSVLREVCTAYGISLNPNQYVLVSSTLKSYISYLMNSGSLTAEFPEGRMFLKRS